MGIKVLCKLDFSTSPKARLPTESPALPLNTYVLFSYRDLVVIILLSFKKIWLFWAGVYSSRTALN